ncbi:MAG: hypothetical protein P0Y56_06915 [Candidatus Andeanibacterium colombiense]|uniref:Uncharacterized protein n=1 Tax=Candidatus Andeanibacterium colombiense TaxID=3121345 RepID=A0AAJ5XB44_9SPHN|nr:MAG: hypothetical protein P0Y56_06915 [Sphingomonadaceae bacterium]
MKQTLTRATATVALALGLASLAACGPAKVKSTPPPPVIALLPPPVVAVPMRPMPPRSSAIGMILPTIGPDGVRNTVNARLNPTEMVWNLRSGWNVAALNCLDARYQPILDGYKSMLKANSKRLTKANADLDKQFRTQYGAGTKAIRARETYLTSVYNYFALPPARDYFCEAALQMSNESLSSPPKDLDAFAAVQLPRLEAAFEHFFLDMERWRIDVAQWDAKYAPATSSYGAAPAGGTVYTNATYGPQPTAPVVQPLRAGGS